MRYEIKTHSSPLSFAILGFIFLAGDPQKFSLATPGAAAQEQPAGQDRVNSSEGSAHSSKNLAELYRDEGKYDGADEITFPHPGSRIKKQRNGHDKNENVAHEF